jgi:hypothetical protein
MDIRRKLVSWLGLFKRNVFVSQDNCWRPQVEDVVVKYVTVCAGAQWTGTVTGNYRNFAIISHQMLFRVIRAVMRQVCGEDRVLVGTCEGRSRLERLGVDGKTGLKQMVKKDDGMAWTEFSWLR